MNAATTRDWYNRLSGIYDRMAESSERPGRILGLKLVDPQPGERILEIGFGTGHAIIAFAHAVGPGGQVVGFDLSDRMKRLAQERVDEENVSDRVELLTGDARENLPAGPFDAVFLSFTLELFDSAGMIRVLENTRLALKKEGRVGVVALHKEDPPSMGSRVYEKLHHWFPTYVDCHPIDEEAALIQAGFKPVKTESFSMWGISGRAILATLRTEQ